MNLSAKEVATMLAQRMEGLAKSLFPNGKKVESYFCVGSWQGEMSESLMRKLIF